MEKEDKIQFELDTIKETLVDLVSELLKRGDQTILDITAMDRIKELQKIEHESEGWKNSSYVLAVGLQAVLDAIPVEAHECNKLTTAVGSAQEALKGFRKLRLEVSSEIDSPDAQE